MRNNRLQYGRYARSRNRGLSHEASAQKARLNRRQRWQYKSRFECRAAEAFAPEALQPVPAETAKTAPATPFESESYIRDFPENECCRQPEPPYSRQNRVRCLVCQSDDRNHPQGYQGRLACGHYGSGEAPRLPDEAYLPAPFRTTLAPNTAAPLPLPRL